MTTAAVVTAAAADHGTGTGTGTDTVNTLRSEWTKLRSVRSTYWTGLLTIVLMIGIGILICLGFRSNANNLSIQDRVTFDPTLNNLGGIFLAQIAVGVLGVLVITSEYGTGMIRTTLTAVPRRGLLLASKAAVFAVLVFVVGTATALATFGIGQKILSSVNLSTSLSDPGVLRAVIGAGLYLTVVGLLSLGLGTIIRHTAGAISAVFAILLVLPILSFTLPSAWQDAIQKWLPSNAGQAIMIVRPSDTHSFGPWTGFALFCGYAAATMVVGWILMRRRDA